MYESVDTLVIRTERLENVQSVSSSGNSGRDSGIYGEPILRKGAGRDIEGCHWSNYQLLEDPGGRQVTDEPRKIIASVFMLSDTDSLTKQEMVNLFIYNLRFFDPEDSRSVVEAAKSSGYLRIRDDGSMELTFDQGSVGISPEYRPPEGLDVNSLSKPLMERLIDAVMESGLSKKEAISSINKVVESYSLLFPAAAVYVGLENGADMSRFFPEVKNFIIHGQG